MYMILAIVHLHNENIVQGGVMDNYKQLSPVDIYKIRVNYDQTTASCVLICSYTAYEILLALCDLCWLMSPTIQSVWVED